MAGTAVGILLGHGDGHFAVGREYSLGGDTGPPAIGDLNGDGAPDLVLKAGQSLWVLHGGGDGTFDVQMSYGTGGLVPWWTGIWDQNGDGWPDLTITNAGGDGYPPNGASVAVLLNNGFATPTLLTLFEATWKSEGFELRWQFGGSSSVFSVAVERGDRSDGPWAPVAGDRRDEGETSVLIDREVEAGHTYYYRLVMTESGGAVTTSGPITATAGSSSSEFALIEVPPSPSLGSSRISFIMPREAHVRLSVLDVMGRRVARPADGTYPAGRHEAVWNAGSGAMAAPAGLYVVRFEWPDGSATGRLALTR